MNPVLGEQGVGGAMAIYGVFDAIVSFILMIDPCSMSNVILPDIFLYYIKYSGGLNVSPVGTFVRARLQLVGSLLVFHRSR